MNPGYKGGTLSLVTLVSRTRCSAKLLRSGAPLIRDRSRL
jgi:hypothetical protein